MDEMNEDGGGQGVKKSGQQRGTENVESVVALSGPTRQGRRDGPAECRGWTELQRDRTALWSWTAGVLHQ